MFKTNFNFCNNCYKELIEENIIKCNKCNWCRFCSNECKNNNNEKHNLDNKFNEISNNLFKLYKELDSISIEYINIIIIIAHYHNFFSDNYLMTLFMKEEDLIDIIKYFDFRKLIKLIKSIPYDQYEEKIIKYNLKLKEKFKFILNIQIQTDKNYYLSYFAFNQIEEFSYRKFFEITKYLDPIDRFTIKDILEKKYEDNKIIKSTWWINIAKNLWKNIDNLSDKEKFIKIVKIICSKLNEDIPSSIIKSFINNKKILFEGKNIIIFFSKNTIKFINR